MSEAQDWMDRCQRAEYDLGEMTRERDDLRAALNVYAVLFTKAELEERIARFNGPLPSPPKDGAGAANEPSPEATPGIVEGSEQEG